jgi:hypothetical protein
MPGLRLINMNINKINSYETFDKSRYFSGNNILSRLARKSLFVFTTFCFVVFATNVIFVLHIDCEHNHNEQPHSSPNCSDCQICQKLITSLTSFDVEPQIFFVDRYAEEHTVHILQNINLSGFYSETISSRGPPL